EGGGALAHAAATGAPKWIREIAGEPGYRERAYSGPGVAFAVRGSGSSTGAVVILGADPLDATVSQLLEETGWQLGRALERREIQEELCARQETVRRFLDEAPFSYRETDDNGVVVQVNRTECELLGLDASEIVGRPVWDFVTPEERD